MEHVVKIEFPFYVAVREGRKNFEIRCNDRGYQAGDSIVFLPLTELGTVSQLHPRLKATIGYVTAYQQKEGFVVFSLLNIQELKS